MPDSVSDPESVQQTLGQIGEYTLGGERTDGHGGSRHGPEKVDYCPGPENEEIESVVLVG